MDKKEIKTDMAPAAIGPYSQGVRVGGFVFVSGQIPVHPKTGDIVPGGVKEETRRGAPEHKGCFGKRRPQHGGRGEDHGLPH